MQARNTAGGLTGGFLSGWHGWFRRGLARVRGLAADARHGCVEGVRLLFVGEGQTLQHSGHPPHAKKKIVYLNLFLSFEYMKIRTSNDILELFVEFLFEHDLTELISVCVEYTRERR